MDSSYINTAKTTEGRSMQVTLPPEGKSAFGEALTAHLSPIFQGSFEYTVSNTELTTNTTANTGTVTQGNGMAVVGSGTTTASTALLQSKRHAKYKAGMGGNNRFTTLFTTGVANTEQYAGLADTTGSTAAFKNGYMVGYDGATFGFHRFQNDVKFSVAQSAWDDPLDGTGASGMTIDHTKLNVWQIQFQYLGAGAIRLYVEDDTTGMFVLVHTIHYANKNTTPSVHNPNFHFTLWVNNGSTTSDIVLKSSSYAYFIEGANEFVELHQPQQSSGLKQKTTVTTEVAIFTIRNKTAYASKTNYVDIVLENVTGSIEASAANNLGLFRLVKNATLGGSPSYADINTANSVCDIDVAGTTVTGGIGLIEVPLAGKNDKEVLDLIDYKVILGPGETVTLAGTSANSATIEGSLLWRELF